MINVALDTNTAIALFNHEKSVPQFLSRFEKIYLPITVCGELMFGARNSKLSEKNETRYKNFIDNCEQLQIHWPVIEAYANVRVGLRKIGKPIPENDIWIAATCIAYNIPLFTFDKHFQHVEGLRLVVFEELL